ncbi:MAG TPA: acyloxyacyl hydrolase [Alphaproteobacteria bacterium]|nr:acyloxyacyl hydrolase [Alphaproteobacteria bacterium]
MLRYLIALGCAALVTLAGAARDAARADDVVNAIAIGSGVLLLESLFVDTPTKDEPDFVSIEGGRFDPIRNEKTSNEFGAEYRSGIFLWKLKPFVGVGGTTNGSGWGYGGIRLDTYWGRRIIITPSFAIVGYARGSGKALGSPLLGRSGFDFQYRFDNDMRIGIGFHHMSNGKVFGQKNNPGTELVGLTFSVPVQKLVDIIP